ncbi:MAG: homocitrate synthase/isopropylmalate synthase family protein, partial [Gaiellaceae bacterium]
LGKHSGRHAFGRAVEAAGLMLTAEELADAFVRFKALADSGREVVLDDVFAGAAAR